MHEIENSCTGFSKVVQEKEITAHTQITGSMKLFSRIASKLDKLIALTQEKLQFCKKIESSDKDFYTRKTWTINPRFYQEKRKINKWVKSYLENTVTV